MSPAAAPAWLGEFQALFGSVLRTSLDRSSGTLRARSSAYDAVLSGEALDGPALSGIERLAVYNRQYWCRLFGVLQSEHPLTARLLGLWLFNDYAARFLLAFPPRDVDIHKTADGFAAFVGAAVTEPFLPTGHGPGRLPRAALLEAATIDVAWRRVAYAAGEPAFHPSEKDAERLGTGRLRPRSGWSVVDEHWPLVQLRRDLAGDPGEAAVKLPPRLKARRSWAIFRAPGGAAQLALAPRQASLFKLLTEHKVPDALARIESTCPADERARLPAQVRAWLAQSVALGFWSGVDVD